MLRARPICCSIALALTMASAGCSIRPLPETAPTNFPRSSTFDIVRQVRCEAQEALVKLTHGRNREHVRQIINATSIGYDFELEMVEHNDVDGGMLGFNNVSAKTGSKRSASVSVTGKADRSRANKRAFRIIEDLADVEKADCSIPAVRANVAYPLSGRLRVDDVVRTYVRLEMISNLDAPEGSDDDDLDVIADAKEGRKGGVFSEHLQFRTTLSAGVNPVLQLKPVSGGLKLTNAGVTLNASRDDTHSLIIAFAQDPNFKDPKVQRALSERWRAIQRKDVRAPRTADSLAQSSADRHSRLELELSRVRNLSSDEVEGAKFLGRQLLRFLRPPDEGESENQP